MYKLLFSLLRVITPYTFVLFILIMACSDGEDPTSVSTDPTDPTSGTTNATNPTTVTTDPTISTTVTTDPTTITTDPTTGSTATTDPTAGTTITTDPTGGTTVTTDPTSGATATTDPTGGTTTDPTVTSNPTDPTPTTNPTDPTNVDPPVGTFSYEIVDFDNNNNITIRFIADFTDPNGEDLTYFWSGFTPSEEINNTATATLLQNRFYGGITVTVTNESGASTQIGLPGNGFSTDISNQLIFSEGTTFQTMEGIGAFGAQNYWWSSVNPADFHSPAFLDQIIDDLGLTAHRDEYYPDAAGRFPGNSDDQDSDWNEQLPFLQALKAKVEAAGMTNGQGVEDFKWLATLWTPPRQWKSNGSHKNGGFLLPQYYDEFATYCTWIVEDYANDIGIDLYGLSIQNEPRFTEFYNSCELLAPEYRDLIKVVKQEFDAQGITTELFGPEDVTVTSAIIEYFLTIGGDVEAIEALTPAIHGYNADGVSNGGSAGEWELVWSTVQSVGRYKLWMTETSGTSHTWVGGMQSALRMYEAFGHGNVSLWTWWSLHTPGADLPQVLYHNLTPGFKYATTKQFSKFVRPGAKRVFTKTLLTNDDLLMVGFKHENYGQKTIVVINQSNFQDYDLDLVGDFDSQETYQIYRTSNSELCDLVGAVNGGGNVSFPASSVTTLFYEE